MVSSAIVVLNLCKCWLVEALGVSSSSSGSFFSSGLRSKVGGCLRLLSCIGGGRISVSTHSSNGSQNCISPASRLSFCSCARSSSSCVQGSLFTCKLIYYNIKLKMGFNIKLFSIKNNIFLLLKVKVLVL